MTPSFANCSSTTLPWWKLALSVCLNHASCRQALACNWRCLCPGQPVPLSTTLPWWKLAFCVCLGHACSLSSDVIASCRQAMACNWRCLCPGQPVPLSTIFFGRGPRIQHVDIAKKVHLFLLCLAQAVLVFQLWLIASCRQAIACNWGGGARANSRKGWHVLEASPSFQDFKTVVAWIVLAPPSHKESGKCSTSCFILVCPKILAGASHLTQMLKQMHFGHNMPGIEILMFFSFCLQLYVLLCHFLASLWQLLKVIAFHIGVGFGHKPSQLLASKLVRNPEIKMLFCQYGQQRHQQSHLRSQSLQCRHISFVQLLGCEGVYSVFCSVVLVHLLEIFPQRCHSLPQASSRAPLGHSRSKPPALSAPMP